MDFALTEAQQDLAGLTRQIATDGTSNTRLREVETGPQRHDPALWSELARAGVLSAALPEHAGGGGFGLLEQCSVLIELGRAVAPVPYLASITMGAAAIARFGTPQQQQWATAAGTGELLLTVALTEQHNPEPASPLTSAERSGHHWMLTGTKFGVPAGIVADAFLVPASTPDGAVVFLICAGDEGVSLQPQRVVDGDAEALVEFTDVRLDGDRVLGELGNGVEIIEWLIRHGTVSLCAAQLGVTERALELTSHYAAERTQFDRPIGSFQAVSQRLADAFIDVAAIRLTMWQAAWLANEHHPCDTEVATAKFWAADGGHRVAHTAVHVHGGVGIDMDHPLHRYFVTAKRNEFMLGGATEQLRRIGSDLAATPVCSG